MILPPTPTKWRERGYKSPGNLEISTTIKTSDSKANLFLLKSTQKLFVYLIPDINFLRAVKVTKAIFEVNEKKGSSIEFD